MTPEQRECAAVAELLLEFFSNFERPKDPAQAALEFLRAFAGVTLRFPAWEIAEEYFRSN